MNEYDRIAAAIAFLAERYRDQPSLDEAAGHVGLSPFHFQRLFTEWAGVSPKKFVQYLTVDYLRGKLRAAANLADATDAAGLSSPSRLHDLFVTIEAVTPGQYRGAGQGLDVVYGVHETPFGRCFLAVTERGVCGLTFDDDAALDDFRRKWPFATLRHDPEATAAYITRIFAGGERLRVLAQGTNFQLKVWEALLRIPAGEVRAYGHLAADIGSPKAVRAVGTAVGANPVAYLIPCHRVIRAEGLVGEYRWGAPRKMALLGRELAQAE